MLIRIGNLIIKELIQFGRDRLLSTFILLAPALQLFLMAQSVEQGVSEQATVVMDLDRSRLSRQLATGLENTEELDVRYYVDTTEEMRRLLDGGQARLAVIIPTGFGRGLADPAASQTVQLIADGTNTVAAGVVLGAAGGVVARFSADLAESYGLVTPEYVDFRTNVRFNPALDFRDYTIPAQLGFIVYQVTLAVASLGLARERELGTLEQLMVTPMRRLELTLGKGVPAAGIGLVNFGAMWLVGQLVFHVPMNGSLLLLTSLTVLFVVTVVGWGLFISAISRTQQQAILFVFIQAMVDITFSGFLVAVENMPPLLQLISRIVPLQHYLVIIRSIMLKGAGWQVLWPQVLALAILMVAVWSIALRSTARRLE
ncbi:MAG: ABC transporter permease [Anaerolineae bacterium]|jgi:ABC-2 type transport system permease protein